MRESRAFSFGAFCLHNSNAVEWLHASFLGQIYKQRN